MIKKGSMLSGRRFVTVTGTFETTVDTITHVSSDETTTDSNEQVCTIEALVDDLFLCLAGVKEIVTNAENGKQVTKQVTVRKYYRQARELLKWIPIAGADSPFIIYLSDLTPQIKIELDETAATNPDVLTYILTQAVGRLFENLDFEYYHLSIARNLNVGLEK
jgi:hypothetical protein